ncbi:MAG: hypothetical protein FDZ70_03325 [Actinobacteria bacterium]|nr:MAG: hypothetical protein FDZ70_03325 [Actinomycetota bacterium]
MDGLLNAIMVGGVAYLAFAIAMFAGGVLVAYLIIKNAVRDGMIQAIKRTGLDSAGGSTFIHGYPPPQ